MTSTDLAVTDDMMDFSKPAAPIRFRIDPDVFEAPAQIPAFVMLEFAELNDQLNPEEQPSPAEAQKLFRAMFELVLTEDSATRFIDRLSNKQWPIDIDQVQRIIPYLMGRFGLRPTEPSDNSSDGSAPPPSGPSSTVNTPPAGSMSGIWTPPDS